MILKLSEFFVIVIIIILSNIKLIETCYRYYKTNSFHCFTGLPKLLVLCG